MALKSKFSIGQQPIDNAKIENLDRHMSGGHFGRFSKSVGFSGKLSIKG